MTDVTRPDTTDMIVVHQSLRREFDLLPDLVLSVPDGELRRAATVRDHLAMMLTSLHDHHAGEDAVLWPALLATGRVDGALIDAMQSQHDELAGHVGRTQRRAQAWRIAAESNAAAELAAEIRDLSELLHRHLELEESQVLPTVRAYLTVGDWDRLREESRRRQPRDPRVQLRLLGGLLEDATPAQREAIFTQMPAAARLLWRIVGAALYRRYARKVRRS